MLIDSVSFFVDGPWMMVITDEEEHETENEKENRTTTFISGS